MWKIKKKMLIYIKKNSGETKKVSLAITDCLNHGTTVRTGIICKKISLKKSIEFSIAQLPIKKEQKLLPDHELAEKFIFVFCF